MLPMMVGLVLILVRVNTAIQVSIVNQQYARMHALFIAFNSPVYPGLKLREGRITSQNDNQMVIGVSDNVPPTDGTSFTPAASTSYVARKPGKKDQDDKEAAERANVRIRDTVTICTQPNVVRGQGGSYVPILPLDPKTFAVKGNYNLGEGTKFEYCRSNLKYPVDGTDGG